MKTLAIETNSGKCWITCPTCVTKIKIPPETRVSDLSSVPLICTGCLDGFRWSPVHQGVVSLTEMAARRETATVLKFRSRA